MPVLPPPSCQKCGLPLVWIVNPYGAFWGTTKGRLGPGECPATTGPWGLGFEPHTPPHDSRPPLP